jgi:periplasmic protein TonB
MAPLQIRSKNKSKVRRGSGVGPSEFSIPRPPASGRLTSIALLFGGIFVTVILTFLTGSLSGRLHLKRTEEIVTIYEAVSPPEKVEEAKPPPIVPPPVPAQAEKEPERTIEPPKPVFGLQEEALEGKGDMAVATGNTLMKAPDTIVEKPSAPLPPAPVQLDREPEMLVQMNPVYPSWAEEQGVTAKVIIMVTIDAEGNVTDAKIKTSGGKDFDNSALGALGKCRFKPLIRGGHATPARFSFLVDFQL